MDLVLEPLRMRLTGAFPQMMRTAIAPFDDETIWWQPAPGVNPIAVILLHCAGNLQHYIGRYIGGSSYERNRPAEFDTSRRLSKSEVIAEFDRAIADVSQVMQRMTPEQLAGPSPDPEERHASVYEDLLNATVHLALHTGQAIQLAKLKEYKLPEQVWGDAHRTAGLWRNWPGA